MKQQYIDLTFGRLAYCDTKNKAPAVVFFHSNSASKKAFQHQLESKRLQHLRLLAVDLPGHGASDDSAAPDKDYPLPGLAAVATDFLDSLSIDKAVFIGASLGGNIALEMASLAPERLAGIMTIGTAPISKEPDCLARAFHPHPDFGLGFTAALSDEEVIRYAALIFQGSDSTPDYAVNDCRRSDISFREMLGQSMANGNFSDEVATLKNFSAPTALVRGSDDVLINEDYLQSLEIRNLWQKTIVTIQDAGHVPHWQSPEVFNSVLGGFLSDCY